jgi:outer membrane protein assembly factor BamB
MFGEDTLWWDLGTSPVLTRDFVVVATQHDKPSYIAAFDKLTGDLAWKQGRNMDAPREANQSYTTPVVRSENGKETIYVLGADHVTAHDAKTGREIWRVGGLNPRKHQFFRSIASPVIAGGILVAPYARGDTLTAIRLGGSGDVTDTHVMWEKQGLSADIPTPAAIDGKVYLCTDRGLFACLDIRTGEVLWSGKVTQGRVTISPSPVLVDGKIYVTSENATTYVLQQGNEFELLAVNEIGEFTLATPVFTRNHILIRTFENLYCIGE